MSQAEKPSTNSHRTRVGVDTGGTFTDFIVIDAKGMRVYKCPSTPDAPERAILNGLAALQIDPQHCEFVHIVHGSTVATNAVLERKGAKVSYVTNRGLGDVLTIGRQARAELYNLQPQPQAPPVPKSRCLEVAQRTAATGEEIESLTEADIQHLIAALQTDPPEAVAINLLFSYCHPAPENALAQAIAKALPDCLISRSFDILPEQREYERGMATWLNASVSPLISRYLLRLQESLAATSHTDTQLSIMQSAARLVDANQAAKRAVNLLLSGPAGGLLAAQYIGQKSGASSSASNKLMTFDMGGTSTDVALIKEDIRLTTAAKLASYPVAVPMIDMHTIGAGGGSIARVDAAGMLLVGPESTGAVPGPACYGLGGKQATVTDANVVLGRLPAHCQLGGEMALDKKAAESAIAELAQAMGCDSIAAARAVITLANEHMAEALRVISVQRGEDPADYQLMSFGGAGGLHVCALADALQMNKAIAPIHAGVLSAVGMLTARPGREFSRGLQLGGQQNVSEADIQAIFDELKQQALTELSAEGITAEQIEVQARVDLRYLGQSHCLTMDWHGHNGLSLAEDAFHQEHERQYGHRFDSPVEWVTLRLTAMGPAPDICLPELAAIAKTPKPESLAHVANEKSAVPIYNRNDLGYGQCITGPAIVTETVATTYIDQDWQGEVDRWGNILLSRMN